MTGTRVDFANQSLARWFDETSGEGELVSVDIIDPDPDQPRRQFDEEDLAALGASMVALGQIVPVRLVASGDGRYRIIFGERRWRAAMAVGIGELRAQIVFGDEEPAGGEFGVSSEWLKQVAENLARTNLKPAEVLRIVRQVIDVDGKVPPAVRGALGMGVRNLRRYETILRSTAATEALEQGTSLVDCERMALAEESKAPPPSAGAPAPSGPRSGRRRQRRMKATSETSVANDSLEGTQSLVTAIWTAGDEAREALVGMLVRLGERYLPAVTGAVSETD